ncbi:MAG: DnaJ domain-containing protein [Polyangiales bacterium]
MQLPGRLARTTLGDLLGRIYRADASGALELSLCATSAVPAARHRVHVQRGLVIAVELDLVTPPSRIGEVLVSEGFVSPEEIARALALQDMLGASAPRHGEVLVRSGALSAELRDAALRKQARARLDALFALCEGRDAEIRFQVGPAATPRVPRMAAPLIPREFLHGRRRARVKKNPSSGEAKPQLQLTFDRLQALRLLGLSPDADPATIRRAFRVAAARVHPDRHPDAPANEKARLHVQLAELSAAYHLLVA